MNNGEISEGRKLTYYLGLVLLLAGILTCVISFASLVGGCGDRSFSGEYNTFHLPGGVRIQETNDVFSSRVPAGFLAFFGGMVMMMGGSALMYVGRSGVAGSGLVLSPKDAREDLKPWSKMTGGMMQDALEETTLLRPKPVEEDFDTTLRKLHQLYKDGILSESEYQSQKQAILKKISS